MTEIKNLEKIEKEKNEVVTQPGGKVEVEFGKVENNAGVKKEVVNKAAPFVVVDGKLDDKQVEKTDDNVVRFSLGYPAKKGASVANGKFDSTDSKHVRAILIEKMEKKVA